MSRDVLAEAIGAWRATRHPRWAALAVAASKAQLAEEPERPVVGAGKRKVDVDAWYALAGQDDPLDLPRLVAALRTTSAEEATQRAKLLAKRDDPRLVDGLLAILEAPPWRANVFKGFVLGVIEVFAQARDVRARDAMADLAPRYKAILETTVGDWTSTHLARAALAMADVAPKKLSAEDEARLAELEKTFQPLPAKKQGKSRSDADLLELVYASPDDDTPRLVFADSLSERGDERGEFIQLQVQRARGQGSPELLRRERELARDRKRLTGWALPLANGGEFRMGRGFPDRLTVKPASAKKVLGERAWATVKRIDWLDRLSTKLALELIEHPTLAHLTEVSAVTEAIVERLRPIERPWRSLVSRGALTKTLLARLPALTSLEMGFREAATLDPGLFEGLGLQRLRLGTAWLESIPEDLFAPLGSLHTLDIDDAGDLPLGLFRPLQNLRTLTLTSRAPPFPFALLESVRLESLTLRNHLLTEEIVDRVLETQPTLKRLTLSRSTKWLTSEALGRWTSRLERFSVEDDMDSDPGCYALEGGTLAFETVPPDLGRRWFVGAKSLVQRVRFTERVFGEDPLHFYDAGSDDAVVARVATFFDELGIPVER